MDVDLDSALLCINISDSEDGPGAEAAEPIVTSRAEQRAERSALSEADFQALKTEYRPKLENGEIWKTIRLPLGNTVSKAEAQELLHAVEELYFFRRYDEAAAFARRVLGDVGDASNAKGLDEDTRILLEHYEAKSLQKQQAPSRTTEKAS